jgi:hypothetical protein
MYSGRNLCLNGQRQVTESTACTRVTQQVTKRSILWFASAPGCDDGTLLLSAKTTTSLIAVLRLRDAGIPAGQNSILARATIMKFFEDCDVGDELEFVDSCRITDEAKTFATKWDRQLYR